MPLPTLFAALTNPTLPELDANFAAAALLGVIPCVVTGTNVLVLTPETLPATPTITAYQNYMVAAGIAGNANTGATTAAVAGLAALSVYKDTSAGPAALTGNEIQPGNLMFLVYDSSLPGFHLIVGPAVLTGGTVTSVASGTGLTGGPVTTTGTLSLAQIASLRIMANSTGGNAVPSANTLTAILDAVLGTTQGSIIYRNATIWTTLGTGTLGQILTANGAGTNLSWTGGVTRGINAAGNTQGTATLLTTRHNEVTVVAASTGVIMANVIGMPQVVVNRGANTLAVFPPVGGQIDAAGLNTAVTIVTNSKATYTLYSATQAYIEG